MGMDEVAPKKGAPSYADALEYLYSFADYERCASGLFGPARFNLARTERLLAALGNPQQRFPSVLIAGTKGKGSTAAMLASVLKASGSAVGLYSQPHLHTYRERIRVDGRLIGESELARLVSEARLAVEQTHALSPELGRLTTYEIGTALTLQYFAQRPVDLAVLEVGLGGRLDSTNVVQPLVSVITSISLDHVQILGSTIPLIAREKAGIIKEDGVVVCAPQVPEARTVIEEVAAARRARLVFVDPARISIQGRGQPRGEGERGPWRFNLSGQLATYQNLELSLLGAHQLVNAATAVTALEELTPHGFVVSPRQVKQGLLSVRWPGRLEVLAHSPLVIVDGAHNADSADRLREALYDSFEFERLLLILGASADKDIAGIARALAPYADKVLLCRSRHPRAANPEALLAIVAAYNSDASVCGSVAEALDRARELAGPRDAICATGSLFVVAEGREALGVARRED